MKLYKLEFVVLAAFLAWALWFIAVTWPHPRLPNIFSNPSEEFVRVVAYANTNISRFPTAEIEKGTDLSSFMIASLSFPQEVVRGDAIISPLGGKITVKKGEGRFVDVAAVISKGDCVDVALRTGKVSSLVKVNGTVVKSLEAVGTNEERAEGACKFGANNLIMSIQSKSET